MNEIEIVNFQSHTYSHLEFHPKINIIRGTSNHGKSAIVRAITWVINNQPRGIPFLNWNKDIKDGVEVHILFKQGAVSRIVNNKFNGYRIFDAKTEESEKFEAMRADVPDEVRYVSNNMDMSNIHNQDDGYFMLQLTPGMVAKKLNERSGLSDIDKVANKTKRLINQSLMRVKVFEENLEVAKGEIRYLESFKKHEKAIEEIDNYFQRAATVGEKIATLSDSIKTLTFINNAIERCQKILDAKDVVNYIKISLDERLEIANQHTRLRLQLENIYNLKILINQYKELEDWRTSTQEINKLIERRRKVAEEWKVILFASKRMDNINKRIDAVMQGIYERQAMIDDLKKELDSIDMCPTCGADKEHWKYEPAEGE